MNRIFLAAAASAFLFSSCGHAPVKEDQSGQNSRAFYADSAYSSIVITKDTANGLDVYTKTRRSVDYQLVKLLWGKEYVNMLVTEKSEQVSSDGAEGQTGYVDLEGKISEGGNFNKPLWKKRFSANLVNYDWDYFELMYYGCCGAVDGKKVCRYTDGEELANYTGDLYEVQIPNSAISRYVGYWDFNSPLERPAGVKDTLVMGQLTMVDPVSRSAQHITITARNDSTFENMNLAFTGITFTARDERDKYSNESKLLELWSADKAADPSKLDGFSIVLRYEWDKVTEVVLPVKNGKIDISGVHSDLFIISDSGPAL
jgi:hypothetical protein